MIDSLDPDPELLAPPFLPRLLATRLLFDRFLFLLGMSHHVVSGNPDQIKTTAALKHEPGS